MSAPLYNEQVVICLRDRYYLFNVPVGLPGRDSNLCHVIYAYVYTHEKESDATLMKDGSLISYPLVRTAFDIMPLETRDSLLSAYALDNPLTLPSDAPCDTFA